jgi:hypothetical protein
MTNYSVENQWGGNNAPWNLGGTFVLGSRENQNPISFNLSSDDGGKTFTGTMTYENEGPIGVKATQTVGNNYSVQNQWGGSSAPWNDAAPWIIGARDNQRVVKLECSTQNGDGGKTLSGTMTYSGEGPIGFKATLINY